MKNRKNKAMKNYKTYTINWMVLVLLIVLSSCEKDFLEEDLRSGLSPTGFYNNLNEAQMAVNGVYATLNNQKSAWLVSNVSPQPTQVLFAPGNKRKAHITNVKRSVRQNLKISIKVYCIFKSRN